MALNWTTTDKAGIDNGIKILVYGKAGTGKTTLCGTAPSPLIVSAESGLLSLRHKSIPVVQVTCMQDVWDVFTWLNSPAANNILTVCLDSLSEIAEVCLSAEKKKTKDGRAAYGNFTEEMIPLVKGFRDLKRKHVVVTAKEQAVTNDVTNVTTYGPSAPGRSVGPALPYLFDEVFHANTGRDQTGKVYHYLRTRADAQTDAKDRSGVLDEIEYPDLTNIINKIKGAI